jgi:hypothetical protein
MKSILFSFLFIFQSISTFGFVKQDSIIIKGVFLGDFKILKVSLFASNKKEPIIEKNISGKNFSLSLPDIIEPGVYSLHYLNEESIVTEIIIDNNEKLISYELKKGNFFYHPFPVFKESKINQKWIEYINETQVRVDRLNSLFSFFTEFPTQLDNKILRYYQKERRQYYKIFSKFIKDNSSNWAGLIVTNNPYYFSNLRKKPVVRDFLRQEYFWVDIDTSNPKLINSPLYINHIKNYLNYVDDVSKHYPFTQEERQKELKKCIDVILDKFSKNVQTKKFAYEYLFQVFTLENNKELFDYIINKYS